MIRHEAISERLLWQVDEILGFGHDDASLFKAPLSFDISINEIFLPLVSGGRLVVLRPGGERDPHHLLSVIADQRVTFTYLVSSMLDVLLEIAGDSGRLDSLRHVWCGGEVLTPELYERFRTRLGIPMYHGYGPAETTIGVSHVIYRGAAQRLSTSIGRANPNTQLYVLDDELRPVPVGVGGELYVGGFLLGRGYAGAPGLTASRFVANPFAGDGSRLYRTGDLARYTPDGTLDFLGRADNQIKIRGMRLEIEDVEAGLAEHPGVRHTCVVAKKNTAGGTYLVGYVIPAAGAADLREEDVAAWAAGHMVEYMVPARIVVMKEFPLTANGKLDRGALPEPGTGTGPLALPVTDNERLVCTAVATLLRLEAVGVDQDFFRLGGDSLLAISLLGALRKEGLHVTPRQIFTHSVIGALAAVATPADAAAVDHDDVATGPVGGSPVVRWLGETTDAVDGFVQSVVLNTPADLTAVALDTILAALVERHDMLRARLVRGDHWSFDIPAPADRTTAGWQESDRPLDECVVLATGALDPERGVMLRAVWRRDARQLVLVAHHVVVDGMSWRILMEDLATAWHRYASGEPVRLPPVGTSFRRWTQLLEHAAFDDDRAHYRRALPAADAPLGRRALCAADTVARERTTTVAVGPEVTAALLGDLPARFHAGVNDVLLTALAVTLARWRRDLGHDQSFAHVELEGHGREARFVADGAGFEPELSRTVGWFTTLFPVTVDPGAAADPTDPAYLTAALKAVKEDLARVPRNGLSYGVLRHLAGARFDTPAPQVLFNYLGRFDAGSSGDWELAGTTDQLGERRDPRMRLPRALEFNAIAEPGPNGAHRLVTTISWPDGLLTGEDVATIGAYYRQTLTAIAALDHGGHTPSDFPLVALTQADVDELDGPALHDVLPMTPLQEGLYFHSVFDDDSAGNYVEQRIRDSPQPRRPLHAPRRRPCGLRARKRRTGPLHRPGPAGHHRRGDPRPRRTGPSRRIRPGRGPPHAVHPHPRGIRPHRPRPDRAPHHRRRLVGAADAPRPPRRIPRTGHGAPGRRLHRLRAPARRAGRGRERPGVARTARRPARPLTRRRGAHTLRPVRRHGRRAGRRPRRGGPVGRGAPQRRRAQRLGGGPRRAPARARRRLRLHGVRPGRGGAGHRGHGRPVHQHRPRPCPLDRRHHGPRPPRLGTRAPGRRTAAPARLPGPHQPSHRHRPAVRHPGGLRRRDRHRRPARPRRLAVHHRHRQRGRPALSADARGGTHARRPAPLQPDPRRHAPAGGRRPCDPVRLHPHPHRPPRPAGRPRRRPGRRPGTRGSPASGTHGPPDHPGRPLRRRRTP